MQMDSLLRTKVRLLTSLTNLNAGKRGTRKQIARHILAYDKKAHDDFSDTIKYYKYSFIFEDGSFMTFNIYRNYMDVGPCSFDMKKGWEYIKMICRVLGLKAVMCSSCRNEKAFAKLSNSHIIGHVNDAAIFVRFL